MVIRGKVTFSDDEIPLFGVVTITDDGELLRQASLDDDGAFKFFDIPPGIYEMLAHGASEDRAGTAIVESIEVTPEGDFPLEIDIVLEELQEEPPA